MTALVRNTRPATTFAIDEDQHEARALDILAGLPPSAKARFEKFRQWHLRRSAFKTGLIEAKVSAAARKTEAQLRLGRHDREMGRYDLKERDAETGKWKDAADPVRERLAAEVAREKSEIARLSEEGDLPPALTEEKVIEFLISVGSRKLAEAEPIRLKDRKSLFDQLRVNRENKNALLRERRFVEYSPRTKDEQKSLANAQIAAIIERGAINVAPVRKGGTIIFPRVPLPGIISDQGMQAFVPDGVAIFAQAFPEKFQEMVHAKIDALADDEAAMTSEAKAARLTEIDALILRLDHEAEALFQAADAERIDTLSWPRNTAPLAVIGLAA